MDRKVVGWDIPQDRAERKRPTPMEMAAMAAALTILGCSMLLIGHPGTAPVVTYFTGLVSSVLSALANGDEFNSLWILATASTTLSAFTYVSNYVLEGICLFFGSILVSTGKTRQKMLLYLSWIAFMPLLMFSHFEPYPYSDVLRAAFFMAILFRIIEESAESQKARSRVQLFVVILLLLSLAYVLTCLLLFYQRTSKIFPGFSIYSLFGSAKNQTQGGFWSPLFARKNASLEL